MFRAGIEIDRRVGVVLIGDLLCIALFATLGAMQHPEGGSLLARLPEIAAPFVGGWLLVGLAVGTLRTDALADARTAAVRAGVGWLGADLFAQAARATSVVPGGADPAFFVVALLFGGLLLVSWRALASRVV
ncbi:MAG: DUF3054 domain-containing protein [Halobacteriales archaeon]|nr:DUF3054 domain-containing protein [Halobacteriales archaeon]